MCIDFSDFPANGTSSPQCPGTHSPSWRTQMAKKLSSSRALCPSVAPRGAQLFRKGASTTPQRHKGGRRCSGSVCTRGRLKCVGLPVVHRCRVQTTPSPLHQTPDATGRHRSPTEQAPFGCARSAAPETLHNRALQSSSWALFKRWMASARLSTGPNWHALEGRFAKEPPAPLQIQNPPFPKQPNVGTIGTRKSVMRLCCPPAPSPLLHSVRKRHCRLTGQACNGCQHRTDVVLFPHYHSNAPAVTSVI